MEDSPGRKVRNVARRYMEGMEAERVALLRKISDLELQIETLRLHHQRAHEDCRDRDGVERLESS